MRMPVGLPSRAVSTLAPLRTALLGYRKMDVIQCRVREGGRRFRIVEIITGPSMHGRSPRIIRASGPPDLTFTHPRNCSAVA
jgi:hypothetical protein